MVIFESTLTHKAFKRQLEHFNTAEFDRLTLGLAKAASAALFTYFFLRLFGLAHLNTWKYLVTPYGYWFLFEMLGFVLRPGISLCLRRSVQKNHDDAMDCIFGGHRRCIKQDQYLGYRLQLERCRTVLSSLDGSDHNSRHHHHGSPCIQVDRKPDGNPV